jgi:hypothetical protein
LDQAALGEQTMMAYEFYLCNREGVCHLIRILPDRRKNAERITQESVKNWGEE